mmetsp:Transcript_36665/g.82532  ORF Transcript_36665/g.82532 Transcript_36665/m.82532 type:complete len:246 (-) Transcript_36665:320-1057(-)
MTQSLRDCSLRHPRVPECLGHGKQQSHRDHSRISHPSEHAVGHIVVCQGDDASEAKHDSPDNQHHFRRGTRCHHHHHYNRHIDHKKRLPGVHPHGAHGRLAGLRPLQVGGYHRAPVGEVEGDHEPLFGGLGDDVAVFPKQPGGGIFVTSIGIVDLQTREHHHPFALIAVLQVNGDVDGLGRPLGRGYPLSINVPLADSRHLSDEVLTLHCPNFKPSDDPNEQNEGQHSLEREYPCQLLAQGGLGH